MPKLKIKCIFNENLQKEYKFLKICVKLWIIDKTECIKCEAIFSKGHGGKTDITQHINTKYHKIAVESEKGNSVTDYFVKKILAVINRYTQMKECGLFMCASITNVL